MPMNAPVHEGRPGPGPEAEPAADREAAAPAARLRDVWPYVRPHRRSRGLALGLSLLGAGASIAQPLVVRSIVDSFDAGIPTVLFVTLAGLLLAAAVLTCAQQLILERSSERLVQSVRKDLVAHTLRLPLAALTRRSRGDLVSRVTSDTTAMREVLSQGVVELCANALIVVAALVMMALIDPVVLGLVVLVVIVLVLSVALLASTTRPSAQVLQTEVGNLATHVERALGGIRTIRAAVATERETSRGIRAADAALAAGLRVANLKAVVGAFTGISIQVLLLSVVGVGAYRVASGALTVGELSAFVMYMMMIIAPVALFAGTATALAEALGAFARVREILDLPAEDANEGGRTPSPADDPQAPAFELRDVGFAYDGTPGNAPVQVLHGVDLAVRRNEVTALVGPSGAGKSTLFSLFERFYDVTTGTLSFFGEDVRDLTRDGVRRLIAYVEQDAPALAGTIRENLLIGAAGASDGECVAALRSVNLAATDAEATVLLETEVGEDGVLLSGGERQRLAIARALLSDAAVLLLDEATSNLDANNEHHLQEAIERLRGRCTIVVIAHRLATVVGADTIVVLEDGRVVATGDHRSLLTQSPLYRDFASHQLLDRFLDDETGDVSSARGDAHDHVVTGRRGPQG